MRPILEDMRTDDGFVDDELLMMMGDDDGVVLAVGLFIERTRRGHLQSQTRGSQLLADLYVINSPYKPTRLFYTTTYTYTYICTCMHTYMLNRTR